VFFYKPELDVSFFQEKDFFGLLFNSEIKHLIVADSFYACFSFQNPIEMVTNELFFLFL